MGPSASGIDEMLLSSIIEPSVVTSDGNCSVQHWCGPWVSSADGTSSAFVEISNTARDSDVQHWWAEIREVQSRLWNLCIESYSLIPGFKGEKRFDSSGFSAKGTLSSFYSISSLPTEVTSIITNKVVIIGHAANRPHLWALCGFE